MTQQEIQHFFNELHRACSHNDAYSIEEVCEHLGTSYQTALELAAINNNRYALLVLCAEMCKYNLEEAVLMGRISKQKF